MAENIFQPFAPGAEVIMDDNGIHFRVHDPAILEDLKIGISPGPERVSFP